MNLKIYITNLTRPYKYNAWENRIRKIKPYNYSFFWGGILFGSSSLDCIPVLLLFSHLSLGDNIFNCQGILGRNITGWGRDLSTRTNSSKGPNINKRVLNAGSMLKSRKGQSS